MRFGLGTFLLLTLSFGFSTQWDTLYIEPGTQTLGSSNVNSLSLSTTDEAFQYGPALLRAELGDTLVLTLVNHDENFHRIVFDGFNYTNDSIAPGTSFEIELVLDEVGIFNFYGDLDIGINRYLGLAGLLEVGHTHPMFFWQLTETDTNLNATTWGIDPEYYPQYFMINGRSAPATMTDTVGRVTGTVGDTILIAISNHGQMKHAIHFHGYHCTIIFDSFDASRIGWEKETFPVDIGENMVLMLIPDQPGVYPVHDHNLMAVLGAGEYVKGMMTMMQIDE